MREIVLDTETTGLKPEDGHRIVEIGCVELYNHMPTGNTFHCFINPQRDMPMEAEKIHGLSTLFLKDQPIFMQVVDSFLTFIEDSPLVIHNAAFDMRFLNAELNRLCRPVMPLTRAIDTLKLARQKFPGAQVTLDALCRRFSIDNTQRTKHGALIDSELLAQVYLELLGGRQTTIAFQTSSQDQTNPLSPLSLVTSSSYRQPRSFPLSDDEEKAHAAFISTFKKSLWTI